MFMIAKISTRAESVKMFAYSNIEMISAREFHNGYTNFTIEEILKPKFGFVHENGFDIDSAYNLDLSDVYSSCDERQDSDCDSFTNQECTSSTTSNRVADLTAYIQTKAKSKHYSDFLDLNKRVNNSYTRPVIFRQQHGEDDYLSSESEVGLDLRIQRKKTPPQTIGNLPAWVYCTRYSDRPSAGPRARKRKVGMCQRRTRTAFNDFQLQQLNIEFDSEPYLSESRRQQLAEQLNLNESNVKIWFQNRRAKLKKDRVPGMLTFELQALGLYNHRLEWK